MQSQSPDREAKREHLKRLRESFPDAGPSRQSYEDDTLAFLVERKYAGPLNNLYHARCLLNTTEAPTNFRDCQPAPRYKTCNGGLDLHNAFYVSKDGNSMILCVVLDLGESRVEYHFSAKNICVCLSGISTVDNKPVQACYFWIVSISRDMCPLDVYRDLQQTILKGSQRKSVNFINRVSTGVFSFLSMSFFPLKLVGLAMFEYSSKILSENSYTLIQLFQNRLDTSILQWLAQNNLLNRVGATKIPSIAAVLFLSCSIIFLGAKFILSCCRMIRNAANSLKRAASVLVFCTGIFLILSSLFECWDMISSILKPVFQEPSVLTYAFTLMQGAAKLSQGVVNPCVNLSWCISIVKPILEQLKIISTSGLGRLQIRISAGGDRLLEASKKASASVSATFSRKKAKKPEEDFIDLEAKRATVEEPEEARATSSSSAQGLRPLEERSIQITQEFLKKLGVARETDAVLLNLSPDTFAKTRPLFEEQDREEKEKIKKASLTLAILSVALNTMAQKGPSASLEELTDSILSLQKETVIKLGTAPEPDLFFLLPSQIYLQNITFFHKILAINTVIDMLTDFLNIRLTEAERETLDQDMVLLSSRSCPADWIDMLGPEACSSRKDCGV